MKVTEFEKNKAYRLPDWHPGYYIIDEGDGFLNYELYHCISSILYLEDLKRDDWEEFNIRE